MPIAPTPKSHRFSKPGFAYMSKTAHPDLLSLKTRCALTKLYKRLPTELRVLILQHISVPHYPPYRHWDALQYAKPVRAEDIVNIIVGKSNVINLLIDEFVLADMGMIISGSVRILEHRIVDLETGKAAASDRLDDEDSDWWYMAPVKRVDPVGEAKHLKNEVIVMREWLAGGGESKTSKTLEG